MITADDINEFGNVTKPFLKIVIIVSESSKVRCSFVCTNYTPATGTEVQVQLKSIQVKQKQRQQKLQQMQQHHF